MESRCVNNRRGRGTGGGGGRGNLHNGYAFISAAVGANTTVIGVCIEAQLWVENTIPSVLKTLFCTINGRECLEAGGMVCSV